jgi:hypothetical protein
MINDSFQLPYNRHKFLPALVWTLGLAIIVSGLFLEFFPFSPEGKYWERRILNDGPAYYEIKNGQMLLLVCLGSNKNDGFETNVIGPYQEKDGQWICTTRNGKITLQPSLLSIRICGPDFTNTAPRIIFND